MTRNQETLSQIFHMHVQKFLVLGTFMLKSVKMEFLSVPSDRSKMTLRDFIQQVESL